VWSRAAQHRGEPESSGDLENFFIGTKLPISLKTKCRGGRPRKTKLPFARPQEARSKKRGAAEPRKTAIIRHCLVHFRTPPVCFEQLSGFVFAKQKRDSPRGLRIKRKQGARSKGSLSFKNKATKLLKTLGGVPKSDRTIPISELSNSGLEGGQDCRIDGWRDFGSERLSDWLGLLQSRNPIILQSYNPSILQSRGEDDPR
jgi:hypothetical protein